jgi:RNA polymerase sigma factor, sigma-70 family
MPRLDDKILLRKYHEEGDLQAREKLIEQYMALVRSLARRYSYRGEQLDDLVQIGAIGLIKAIDRFDLDRGVELTTYATPNIIGEIKRHFPRQGLVSARAARAAGAERAALAARRIADRRARPLADDPRAREGGGGRGGGRARGARVRPGVLVALALDRWGRRDGDEDLDPMESIGSEEHEFEVSEDRAVLAPGFRVLDERERKILQLRFFDGLTQSQIAQQVGISQMHVSRLIRRSLEKIRTRSARTRRARRAAPASTEALGLRVERREAEVEQALRVAVHVGRVEHDGDERHVAALRGRDEARPGLVRVPVLTPFAPGYEPMRRLLFT